MGKIICKLAISFIGIMAVIYIVFIILQLIPDKYFIWLYADIREIINILIVFFIGITYSIIVSHIVKGHKKRNLIMTINGLIEVTISVIISIVMFNMIYEIPMGFIVYYIKTTTLIGLLLMGLSFYTASIEKMTKNRYL